MGMTREEKEELIRHLKYNMEIGADYLITDEDTVEIIKALEQEPVLDRIRAEIWDLQYGDEEKSMTDENRADAYNNAISQAIEIIDKYKAESGDKTE